MSDDLNADLASLFTHTRRLYAKVKAPDLRKELEDLLDKYDEELERKISQTLDKDNAAYAAATAEVEKATKAVKKAEKTLENVADVIKAVAKALDAVTKVALVGIVKE